MQELIGKTFVSAHATEDEVIFNLAEGGGYKLMHHQDCCESVYVGEISGDL